MDIIRKQNNDFQNNYTDHKFNNQRPTTKPLNYPTESRCTNPIGFNQNINPSNNNLNNPLQLLSSRNQAEFKWMDPAEQAVSNTQK